MKIKFGANIYEIGDTCDLDRRRKRSWKRNLDDHGVEGVLASLKFRDAASCMLEELKALGAEVVDETDVVSPPPERLAQ